jgi:hypothetical protein
MTLLALGPRRLVTLESQPAKLTLVNNKCTAVFFDGPLVTELPERGARGRQSYCEYNKSDVTVSRPLEVTATDAVVPTQLSMLSAPPGLELERAENEIVEASTVGPWIAPGHQRCSCVVTFPGYDATQNADFDLVPRLIGRNGSNVKEISAACGGKVQIRGYGSGHAGSEDQSLRLKLTCKNAEKLEAGKRILLEILKSMAQHFSRYCRQQALQPPPDFFVMEHGSR